MLQEKKVRNVRMMRNYEKKGRIQKRKQTKKMEGKKW